MGEIYTDLHLGPLYQRPRFGRAFYSSPKAERHRFHDLPAGGLVQRDTFVAEAETLCDNGPLVLRTTRVRNHAALRAIATTHCYSRRRDRDAAFAVKCDKATLRSLGRPSRRPPATGVNGLLSCDLRDRPMRWLGGSLRLLKIELLCQKLGNGLPAMHMLLYIAVIRVLDEDDFFLTRPSLNQT